MTPEKALQYDKRLSFKISLDGSKTIYRSSPFNSEREFDIKRFDNMYLGSGRHIRDTLIKMDTQRKSIIQDTMDNNRRIKTKRKDERISDNVADIFNSGGDTFIN